MKRKHNASVSLQCDRLAKDSGQELMSLRRVVDTVANVVGDGLPLPTPFQWMYVKGGGSAKQATIQKSLDRMFETHMAIPNPHRISRVVGPGPPDKFPSYITSDVGEWLWSVVAEYVDAKILSTLPRTSTIKSDKAGKAYYQVDAEDGRGWPRSDDEWHQGASLIALWLNDAGELLDNVSVDTVVAYIIDSVMHSTGVTIDTSMVQEHFSAVMTHIEPSIFLAKTLLRSSLIAEFVGDALAIEARRRQIESDWNISFTTDDTLLTRVSQEMADTRKLVVAAKRCKDMNAIRDLLGMPLVVTENSYRGVNLRSQQDFLRRKSHYQNLTGMVAAHVTVSGNCKLSGFYRALGANPDDIDAAVVHLNKCWGVKPLRELALNTDDGLDIMQRDDFQKACKRLDMGLQMRTVNIILL